MYVDRKATEQDLHKLDERARAFVARHNLDVDEEIQIATSGKTGDYAHYMAMFIENDTYLSSLWQRIFQRATGSKKHAHGYFGS